MTEYTLTSTPMIHTPGLLRFAQQVYTTQPTVAKQIMRVGYAKLPTRVISGLLSGAITYRVENETVIVSVGTA
jgi:hypothetical protein